MREVERTLWVAVYVTIVLAPLALVAVAVKPGAQGRAVVFAAALGFARLALIVLQPLLSGRWPAITAAFGLRSVLNLHRQAGIAALALAVVHVVVLVADDPSRVGLLDVTSAPLRAKAGIVTVIGLVVLAAASTPSRRGRSYERWRAVHLLAVAAVLVGCLVHVLGVGAYSSLPTFSWGIVAIVLVGAAALYSVRVARPYSMARRPFRVRSVRPERGNAVTLELEAEDACGVRFSPGQFAWLKAADRPLSMDEHPLSFASSADETGRPTFTARAVGDFTSSLRSIPVGTRLLLDGPHGEPAHRVPRGAGRILLAAGIGITPIMSVLRTARASGDERPLLLLYGNRRWEDVTFREELRTLERAMANLTLIHTLSQPPAAWDGEIGRIDAAMVRRHVGSHMEDWPALVCGPPAMVTAMTGVLAELGKRPGSIQAEGFG